MSASRRLRVLAELSRDGPDGITTRRLCEVSRSITGMTGAGIMLLADDQPLGSLCTTGEVSGLIEELQFSLGEGPCIDAHRLGRPVLEPDLADPVEPRWIAFTESAVDAGARAVFGFPLRFGSVRVGALNLFRDERGPLTDDQHTDALVVADVVAHAVVAMQSGAAPEALGDELEAAIDLHAVVHQAAGMVSVQLDVPIRDALGRLRAHAFSIGRTLTDVATDVVARRLRLDPAGR